MICVHFAVCITNPGMWTVACDCVSCLVSAKVV